LEIVGSKTSGQGRRWNVGLMKGVHCVGIWVAVGLGLMGLVVRYCLMQNFSMYGGTYSDEADALLIY
jgi:hypothetical protein